MPRNEKDILRVTEGEKENDLLLEENLKRMDAIMSKWDTYFGHVPWNRKK